MLLIKNGYIKTMAGDDIERGYLLIGDDGKIAEVGAGDCSAEADEVIDAEGRIVSPGIVEAHCHIGYGNGAGSGFNEYSDPFTPHMSVLDAIDPYSDDLLDAVRGGITTACTGPGSTNLIGGTFAAIKTHGTRTTDMIVKYPLAMKCAVGENPCNDFGVKQGRAPRTRMAVAAMLREFLRECKAYSDALLCGEAPSFNVKYNAMLPVMRGELPLKIHVHASHDIYTVLRITEEFGLKFTIDHCTDGERVVDDLAACGCACFIGPSYGYTPLFARLMPTANSPSNHSGASRHKVNASSPEMRSPRRTFSTICSIVTIISAPYCRDRFRCRGISDSATRQPTTEA